MRKEYQVCMAVCDDYLEFNVGTKKSERISGGLLLYVMII